MGAYLGAEPATAIAASEATDWSRLVSRARRDEALEREIESILGEMTLEEKLGQMIQAEVQQFKPGDIETYKIGSGLNGAGVWPAKNRFSSPLVWAEMVDGYWSAAERSFAGRPFRIPFAWATDAVHGHNNLFNATVFPHNLGLGATRDAELIRRIGEVTAAELAASGMDWTFAPTVAVPLDARWGRFYEGYSQDPEVVRSFAEAMVLGLQGDEHDARSAELRVLSSIKHWIGDGGTRWGVDRGANYCSEEELLELHAPGYAAALAAGAQVVMVSFSSWVHERNYDFTPEVGLPYNGKMHGSRYLIRDVLKERMGFDGVVLTDWDGHCEVTKCTLKDARYCINAGADILMVEARGDWLAILDHTRRDLEEGHIVPERIDDAVRRILRVKWRSTLREKVRPAEREVVRDADRIVGCAAHRTVAREAVRKSLVLLKNDGRLLPLARNRRVLVAGSAADSLPKHLGGWSLSWQSNHLAPEDFPSALTLAGALQAALEPGCFVRHRSGELLGDTGADVAVVALGEDAYAEMMGDIRPWDSLEYASLKPSYAHDLALLHELNAARVPVVCVYFGGRPLYMNEEINLSRSFIAAWLPGIAGEGIADLLLRAPDSSVEHEFTGTLPCAWPATPYGFRLTRPMEPHTHGSHPEYAGDDEVLFPVGYGLRVANAVTAPRYRLYPRATVADPAPALNDLVLLGPGEDPRLTLRIAGNGFWVGADVSRVQRTEALLGELQPINRKGVNDAVHVYFNGRIASLYLQLPDWNVEDMRGYLAAKAELAFDIRIHALGKGPVRLSAHNRFPSVGVWDATSLFVGLPVGEWTRVRIPLRELAAAGSDFSKVNVPFMLHTEAEMRFDIGDLRWEIATAHDEHLRGSENG